MRNLTNALLRRYRLWTGPISAGILMAAMSGHALGIQDTSGFAQFPVSDYQIEAQYSPHFRACIKRSGGVTASMRECSASEHDRLDARLNRAYADAMARLLAPQDKTALRQYQREWLAIRGQRCLAEMEQAGGGTASLLVGDGCGLNQMIRRILWLERYAR
jgi:uncharacterized protein YecT (DUF1311 family)